MPPKPPRSDRPAPQRNDHRDAFLRGTSVESGEDQMARAGALAETLEALRIQYEQYFLGLIRKPPNDQRAALRTAILQLKSSFVRNTAVKFRVASIHNRFLSYERMWDRTLKEMEDGTYRRDLFKARLHRGAAKGDEPKAAPKQATRPPEAPGGLDDARVREIHAAYVEARRRCGESTEGITPEAIGNALRKQVPALLEKYGQRSLEFRVVIQGGKAVMKSFAK